MCPPHLFESYSSIFKQVYLLCWRRALFKALVWRGLHLGFPKSRHSVLDHFRVNVETNALFRRCQHSPLVSLAAHNKSRARDAKPSPVAQRRRPLTPSTTPTRHTARNRREKDAWNSFPLLLSRGSRGDPRHSLPCRQQFRATRSWFRFAKTRKMAGVGRRTLYRKSVTDDYLNSTPEPGENEEIALAQAPRGSNIIEVSFRLFGFRMHVS